MDVNEEYIRKEEKYMICKKCGFELESKHKFCPNCGETVPEHDEEAAPAAENIDETNIDDEIKAEELMSENTKTEEQKCFEEEKSKTNEAGSEETMFDIEKIPAQYRPIGMWGYFGLNISHWSFY